MSRIVHPRAALIAAGVLLLAACNAHAQESAVPTVVSPARASTVRGTGSAAAASVHAVAPSAGVANTQMTSGREGFSGLEATLTKSLIGDDGYLLADYAKRYDIRTVFLPVSGTDVDKLLERDPTTVKNLNALFAVCNVYMLAGDETWLDNPEDVPEPAYNLSQRIGPMYPQFAGILYDIEPQTDPAWNSDRQGTIDRYFRLLDTLFASRQPKTFGKTLVSTQASFARQPNRRGGQSPSMLQAIEGYGAIDGTYLLMAGNSASDQLQRAAPAFAQMTKPYWAVANTSPNAGSNGYAGSTPESFARNMRELASGARSENGHLQSVSVDSWDDREESLEAILPQPAPSPIPEPTGRLVPPDGTDYIGAYVDPNNAIVGPATTAKFEHEIGRTLGYNIHYAGWTSNFPNSDEDDDESNDRIPLISWRCGDYNARIARGDDDALLKERADAFRTFGHPVFLRYEWEMNLPADDDSRQACYDPKKDLPNGNFSPKDYIAAWKHIRAVFKAERANDVVWLWNPGAGGPNPAEYYPGDDEVDWIGLDSYDRHNESFGATYEPDLDDLSQFRKPMLIVETGALSGHQETFFGEALRTLEDRFPLVRGFSYLDADSAYNWSLRQGGIAGFKALAQSKFMSARQPH